MFISALILGQARPAIQPYVDLLSTLRPPSVLHTNGQPSTPTLIRKPNYLYAPNVGKGARFNLGIAKRNREYSRQMFGGVLPDFDLSIVSVGWGGDPATQLGAGVGIAVWKTPSRRHAQFLALQSVTMTNQNTVWPKPGIPKLSRNEARPYGDEVYLMRAKSEFSLVSQVGSLVVRIDLTNGIPGPKQRRSAIDARDYAKWDLYVQDVIRKIRAVEAKR